MPETVNVPHNLEEFNESMQENLPVIPQDATDSADLENPYGTEAIFCFEDLLILKDHYIVRFNTRQEIVNSLVQSRDITTFENKWPVTSEFEGWASDTCIEFCNSHGIIHLLRECRQQVESIFSNIVKSNAKYSCFDEEDGEQDGHVAIEIEVSSARNTVMHEYENWLNWKSNSLKPEQASYFALVFRRV